MADPKQLKMLKTDVDLWNSYRRANPNIKIDLHGANLKGADLRGANLYEADLNNTNLKGVHLHGTDLRGANLSKAHLGDAYLTSTNLTGAILSETRFSRTFCVRTNFGNVDLSKADDLEAVDHYGPSTIGTDTLHRSNGKIPESFLRGCGLSDWEIESAKLYATDLSNEEIKNIQNRIFQLKAQQSLQISSLFISYSHADSAFLDKLEPKLNDKGIRFWRDVHHATAGRLEKVIDYAMRLNPTVLLVLSKDSIQSDWVEHEVNDARKLEKKLGRDVLCPVALDDEWKRPNSWSLVLMEQVKKYNVLDFSQWQDDDKFKGMFGRLVEGLDLFYKK